MVARKQTAIVGLKVRLREPLRKKLETAAKKKGVSLNFELVARLEQSFLIEGFEERIEERMEQVVVKLDKRLMQLDDLRNVANDIEKVLFKAIENAEYGKRRK